MILKKIMRKKIHKYFKNKPKYWNPSVEDLDIFYKPYNLSNRLKNYFRDKGYMEYWNPIDMNDLHISKYIYPNNYWLSILLYNWFIIFFIIFFLPYILIFFLPFYNFFYFIIFKFFILTSFFLFFVYFDLFYVFIMPTIIIYFIICGLIALNINILFILFILSYIIYSFYYQWHYLDKFNPDYEYPWWDCTAFNNGAFDGLKTRWNCRIIALRLLFFFWIFFEIIYTYLKYLLHLFLINCYSNSVLIKFILVLKWDLFILSLILSFMCCISILVYGYLWDEKYTIFKLLKKNFKKKLKKKIKCIKWKYIKYIKYIKNYIISFIWIEVGSNIIHKTLVTSKKKKSSYFYIYYNNILYTRKTFFISNRNIINKKSQIALNSNEYYSISIKIRYLNIDFLNFEFWIIIE